MTIYVIASDSVAIQYIINPSFKFVSSLLLTNKFILFPKGEIIKSFD